MTYYEKRDHLGKMVVYMKQISFYHDNVQITVSMLSLYQCIATNVERITLQYTTWYTQHATHYKRKSQMVPYLIAGHILKKIFVGTILSLIVCISCTLRV